MKDMLGVWLRRCYRRHTRPRQLPRPGGGRGRPGCPPWLTAALGIGLAALLICGVDAKLRPVVEALTVAQVDNQITQQINDTLSQSLLSWDISYSDLVTVQRDSDGTISALSSDMGQLNRLRSQVVAAVLDTIQAADVHTLGVPVGSLFNLELLWARGPRIQVKSLVAGTVSVEVNSQFQSTGINQTLHRILLDIRIPLTILLPGGGVETELTTSLCVAETAIVGQVPDTYLQFGAAGESS